jgi:hypothetical protein
MGGPSPENVWIFELHRLDFLKKVSGNLQTLLGWQEVSDNTVYYLFKIIKVLIG